MGILILRASSSIFPLAISGRRLVTAGGNPFWLHADTAWSLMVQLTPSEHTTYLDDRQARKFNAVICNLIEHHFADEAPETIDSIAPFTSTAFTTPNDTYFERMVGVVEKMRDRGMVAIMTPAYLGHQGGSEGWWSDISGRTTNEMQTYGEYVGEKFSHLPNIIWMLGGDYHDAQVMTRVRAIQTGLAATGHASWLYTYHSNPGESASEVVDGESWLDLDNTYDGTIANLPAQMSADYANTPTRPCFMLETKYEAEDGYTAIGVRSSLYWAICRGLCGHGFGSNPMWHMDAPEVFTEYEGTWDTNLDTQGAQDMQRGYEVLASRGHQTIVPDDGSVLRGGVGTGANTAACGVGATTAYVYTPSQTELTVDCNELPWAATHGWWYRPSNGDVVEIGALSGVESLTPPTTGDHLLVLDDTSAGYGAPG